MEQQINRKRLAFFLTFAFGIAWLIGLVIYLTGGLSGSPEIVPGSKITLAILLITVGYMWAPALANIFTRLVTKQGWNDLLLVPFFKKNWKFWVAAWVFPAFLTIAGGIVYFLVFPSHYDANLTVLQKMISASSPGMTIDPWLVVLGQLIAAILVAPVINSFFTFGEEFGWRGYLLPNLLPLGENKAFLISGIIWGMWHAPVIAMGHNFGLDYPGAPWLGIVVMVWFCILVGTFLSWLSIKAESIWPAVIGHAAINGISALPLLFMLGNPNMILGPTPVGIIGSIGYLAVFIWIFVIKNKTKL
ncbi:MAG: CPBP family intramembrane glutamic endopeptidase [Leptolinea sp.]